MIAMPFYLHSAGLGAGLLFFLLSMFLALDAALVMHRLSQSLQARMPRPWNIWPVGPREPRMVRLVVGYPQGSNHEP